MDKLSILRKCGLFQGVEEHALAKLAESFQEKRFTQGEFLFREGDPSQELCVVAEGSVAVIKGYGAGKTSGKLLALLGPGDSVGEAALYSDRPRTATALAKTNAAILSLTKDSLKRLTQDNLTAAFGIVTSASRIIFERLEHTSQELAAIYDLGKFLGQAPPLDALAKGVTERLLIFAPQAEEVCFYVWNQFTEEYDAVSARGRQGELANPPSLSKDHPLIKEFLTRKSSLNTRQQLSGQTTLYMLCAPLVQEEMVLGFLALSRSASAFGDEYRNLLEAAAGVITGAVLSAWSRQEEEARQRLQSSKSMY